jgi:hypothetical protein
MVTCASPVTSLLEALSMAIGAPHFGQDDALLETSLLHSEHFINPMHSSF